MTYTKFYVFIFLAVSASAQKPLDKEKRGAETYGSGSSKTVYAQATPPSAYVNAATGAPAYSSKASAAQTYSSSGKLSYSPSPVSYEQQQITVQQPVKVAYANQPILGSQHNIVAQPAAYPFQQIYSTGQSFGAQPTYLAQPAFGKLAAAPALYAVQQPNFAIAAQPGPKFSFAQPPVARVAPLSLGGQLGKFQYTPSANIAYNPVAAPAPAQYSSAGAVSSFSFNNPHVTYSNLGLLSQNVGKAYSNPQAVAAPHLNFGAAHAAAPQVYAPETHAQHTSSPQIQYFSTPQTQQSAHTSAQQSAQSSAQSASLGSAQQQYQFPSHHGAPSSARLVYSSPQAAYPSGKVQYAAPGVTYA